jgi:hypothetical protein
LEHLPVVSIAVDGSLRVYDQYGGRLYALEGDGGLRWDRNVATGTSATQLAVSADGITYFITGSTLAALDADGNDAGVYPQSCMQPVIDANGDLFTLCEGALVKLDAHLTGAAWSVPTPVGEYQFMNDSPVIGLNGALYFTVDSEDNPDGGPPDLVMGYVQ